MNIVLVGIGGTGLSSLAYILKDLGYKNIIGIDSSNGQIVEDLQKNKIKIYNHNEYTIKEEDLVIYSDAAINSPEVQQSFKLTGMKGKKHFHRAYSYFQFLGEISKYFKTVSITGTHGKSTTTALTTFAASKIYKNFGLGILGALVPQFDNKNYLLNKEYKQDISTIFEHIIKGVYKNFNHSLVKKYLFVIEADEFNNHFLMLDSDYALITNIELDHSDIYSNFENYFESFKEFIKGVKNYCIGLKKGKNLKKSQKEFPKTVKLINETSINFNYIFGSHNQKNASLAYKIIKTLAPKISSENIKNTLSEFQGLWRRTEYLKTNHNGALVYTDYGHHPSELKEVLNSMKNKFPDKRIHAVFQPHQARRVLEFRNDFQKVLKKFDKTSIYSIYAAREDIKELKKEFQNKEFKNITSISQLGSFLSEKIKGDYTEDISYIENIIKSAKKDEVVIILTAGDLDFKIRSI